MKQHNKKLSSHDWWRAHYVNDPAGIDVCDYTGFHWRKQQDEKDIL